MTEMSKYRPRWPKEEYELWRRIGDQPNDSDVREPPVDALWLFKEKATELLETLITAFINDRCSQKEVGSPDLRRIVRVALSHAITQCANDLVVKNAAISIECGLPWSALAEVTDPKGSQSASITFFQRRWGHEIREMIAQRETKREANGPLEGDADYYPPTIEMLIDREPL